MLEISDADILDRMRFDNPWWDRGQFPEDIQRFTHRDYFAPFLGLVRETEVRRAVVLMGPRRVGKTVLILQTIKSLIDRGENPQSLFYISIDTPVYGGLSLEKILRLFLDAYAPKGPAFVFFDEVQYLRDWEVHLKSLVDSFREIKFIASGSAAAALRMKSRESGAGRFTEFLLPPLTFAEFLKLQGKSELVHKTNGGEFATTDQSALNAAFIDYLNFGGYPELAVSEAARRDQSRYIASDIVEKVLLRDIPSLYGISDVRELNNLFRVLCYNTAQEVSLEGLSQTSQISKNTIRRYIEYLEASFLIKIVERVDLNARHFKRNRTFKVYLTNAALRAALFGPVEADDEAMGSLVETAVFAQWFHDPDFQNSFRYARWKGGEVDLVCLEPATQSPRWAIEIKWSDRFIDRPSELAGFIEFGVKHDLDVLEGDTPRAFVTTRSKSGRLDVKGLPIGFKPAALICYEVGYNNVAMRDVDLANAEAELDL